MRTTFAGILPGRSAARRSISAVWTSPDGKTRVYRDEKFYGSASFLVKQNVYRSFDFKRATALVDAALNLPPLASD